MTNKQTHKQKDITGPWNLQDTTYPFGDKIRVQKTRTKDAELAGTVCIIIEVYVMPASHAPMLSARPM